MQQPKTAYCYDDDFIFSGRATAYWNDTAQDYLLPSRSTLTAIPDPVPEWKSPVYDPVTDTWNLQDDYRGIVYDTTTGQSERITELGPLPAGKTTLAPASEFDTWNGSAWVFDQAKKDAADKALRESEIMIEYQRRKSQITASVNSWTFSARQEDDILKLVNMINEGLITDGQAQLSDMSDPPVQRALTKSDLLNLAGQIASARLALAAQKNTKLADNSDPKVWT